MLKRVDRVEPETAKIAKVRFARRANHVIASYGFLAACAAIWATSCVLLHIIFRGFFFGRELILFARKAGGKFAVPRDFAYLTESECAVFADGETIMGRW